jgi:hypothetical protein
MKSKGKGERRITKKVLHQRTYSFKEAHESSKKKRR